MPPLPEEVFRAFQGMSPMVGAKVLKAKTVKTSETPIAHGLGYVPTGWTTCNLQSAVIPFQTAGSAPDAQRLYLEAASEVTVDLVVW